MKKTEDMRNWRSKVESLSEMSTDQVLRTGPKKIEPRKEKKIAS